jgi:preprotein translocase subunit SecA
VRRFLRFLFAGSDSAESSIHLISRRRTEFAQLGDDALRGAFARADDLLDSIAVTAVVASRVLGVEMFDVQLQGALALTSEKIAEMQTGEGKTLAAVPAVAWYAKARKGVHVMTVNDYLARRDARWMGSIYQFLGFTVSCVQQAMSIEDRQRAYACDITYATANEVRLPPGPTGSLSA